MKDNTLILLGAGALALYLFSKRGSAVTDGGGGGTTNFFQYSGESSPMTNPITGTKFSTDVVNARITSLDLLPVGMMSTNRFTGVTYDEGKTVGVLDKAAQQSITVSEAQKRASNPFIQAQGSIASPAAIRGGVGWQTTVKNYNKNVLGV